MTSKTLDTEECDQSEILSANNETKSPKQIFKSFFPSDNLIGDLANRILLYTEIERLNSVNYFLQKENDTLKFKADTPLQSSSTSKLLEERLEILMNENKNLNNIITSFTNRQSNPLREISSPLQNLKTKPFDFSPDNERLRKQLNEKTERIKVLNMNLQEMQNKLAAAGEFEKTNELLMNELDRLNTLLINTTQELNELKAESHQTRFSQNTTKNENDSFSATLKELQNQLVLWRGKALAYEDKSHTIQGLESSNHILKQEVMKLEHHLQSKQREIESMHKHILDLENGQGVKVKLEQINQVLSEELQQLNIILRDKALVIEELRTRLMKTEQELFLKQDFDFNTTSLQQENERLLRNIAQKEQELKIFAERQREFESKVALVIHENEKANMTLLQQQQESERNQTQRKELERYKALVLELERENKSKVLEYEALTQQFIALSQSFEKVSHQKPQLEQESNSVAALKTQIVFRQREIDTLNAKLAARDDEIFSSQRLIKNLEDKNGSPNHKELEAKIQIIVKDYEKQVSINQDKEREIQGCVLQIKELEKQLISHSGLEGNLAIIIKENDSLNAIIEEKVANIQQLTSQVRELEEKVRNHDEHRLQYLKDENGRLQDVLTELKHKQSSDSYTYSEMERRFDEKINALITENSHLNDIIGSKIHEIENLKLELDNLKAALFDKEAKIQSVCEENVQLSFMLEQEQRQREEERRSPSRAREADREISGLEMQLSRLGEENKRLNHQLILKGEEIERTNHVQQEKRFLERQAQQLEECLQEINRLRRQIEDLQYESRLNQELKNNITLLATENQRVSSLLAEKTKELELVKIRFYEIEEEDKKSLERVGFQNLELNSALSEKLEELEALKLNLLDMSKKDKCLEDLTKKIAQLEEDVQKISSQSEVKSQELQRAEQSYKELEHKLNDMIDENKRLIGLVQSKQIEIDQWGKKCLLMEKTESDKQKQEANTNTVLENNQLKEMIGEYKAYINDLEEKLRLLIEVNERLQKFANEKAKASSEVI